MNASLPGAFHLLYNAIIELSRTKLIHTMIKNIQMIFCACLPACLMWLFAAAYGKLWLLVSDRVAFPALVSSCSDFETLLFGHLLILCERTSSSALVGPSYFPILCEIIATNETALYESSEAMNANCNDSFSKYFWLFSCAICVCYLRVGILLDIKVYLKNSCHQERRGRGFHFAIQ